MPHYKSLLDKPYLGGFSLEPEEELILTIKSYKQEEVKNKGSQAKKCLVLYFKEREKGMIINVSNGETIGGIAKSMNVDKWIGQKITLYFEPSVMFGGKRIGGLRVRSTAPTTNKLPLDESRMPKLVEAIKAGNYSLPLVQKEYTLSPEQLKTLKAIKP